MGEGKLEALVSRLGDDYRTQGYTQGPMPLVTLEAFFEGNDDGGSFQAAPIEEARTALQSIRGRADVADVRLGVTQWEGEGTWPLAEYVYIVTSASRDEARGWLRKAGLHASEVGALGEAHPDVDESQPGAGHRPAEPLEVPSGMRVVWAWVD